MVEIANTPIKICSRASLLIGGNPISSFTDGSSESIVAGAMYEDMARAALTNCRWRFSTSQEQLNRLTEAPTGRFDAAYQLPSGLLLLNAVTVNDFNISYDTYGSKVYCDASENEVLIADYVFRAEENTWPPYFVVAVEYIMAGVLAISVARDAAMAKMMEEKAAMQMMQARRLHSQQQTTKKLNTSRFIAQRRS
mgnify:FL=1|jgi:hypothetical protein|tara:strand:+ start:66 stop:650 length:585 start_codon:yes stop_codon:yes gene_type:complete